MSNLDPKSIRLTETVKKGGCAAKLPAGQLREILKNLKIKKPTELTVGTEHMDDACLWDLKDLKPGLSLVQTLDFFTPIVDDAYDFGMIAAANALSDIYAMGGTPKIALSILAFPSLTLPIEILTPLLQGALDKIHEAGACLAGGHTIDDDTLKFGLSVTGFVATAHAWTNAGAKVGDVLILTKAIGTGTLMSALKNQDLSAEHLATALSSMKQLNNVTDLIDIADVHAATDVTGFGLAGHLLQMARASKVQMRIDVDLIPLLPGTRECLEKKILNRAHRTNWEYVREEVTHETKLSSDAARSEFAQALITDPQTSGGLLLSVPKDKAAKMVEVLKTRFYHTCVMGEVLSLTMPTDASAVLKPQSHIRLN